MKLPTKLFVIGAMIASVQLQAAENHLQLKEVEVEWRGDSASKSVEIEIATAGTVPMDGKSGAFGYAALTDHGNHVLVLVTHLPIDDSSYEQVPSGFHAHVLDLKSPSGACAGATFEVDLESAKANPTFDAQYAWKVDGSEVKVKGIPASDLGDAGVETIASFTLKPIVGAHGKPTNLCVHVIDQR